MQHKLWKEVSKIPELERSLEGIAQDDGKDPAALTPYEITKEAQYLLELFERPSTDLYEICHQDSTWLGDRWGMSDTTKDLRRQYRALKRFVAKHHTQA